MKRKIFLFLASALLCVTSCDDGVVDFDMFKTAEDLLQLVDVPERIDLCVGEDYPLVVRLNRLPYKYSVTGIPEDYGVIDCIDCNDSTVVIRGIAEGETTLTVSYSALSKDIHVTVSDMDLQGFTLSPETLKLSCGETAKVWIDVTPEDYPMRNFRVDLSADAMKSVNANIQYDSVAMRGFVEVSAFAVGDFVIPIVGTERGEDKIRREIGVSCSAVPITDFYFRTPVDTVITERYTSYVFERLSSPCTVRDVIIVDAHWEPENATVTGVSYSVSYSGTGFDGGEHKSYVYSWTDEDVESGAPSFLSPEEIQDLYARGVITSGEDLQRYIDEHFATGVRGPASCETGSGIVRDFGDVGFYCWNARMLRQGKAEITVNVEYVSSYSGLTIEKRNIGARLNLVFSPDSEEEEE